MITVKGTNNEDRVVLWESNSRHPDGEIFIVGNDEAEVWPTARVRSLISDGELVQTGGDGEELDLPDEPQVVEEIEEGDDDMLEPLDVDATDSARELASEYGIDIGIVIGSGADGRVLKKDVESYIANNIV